MCPENVLKAAGKAIRAARQSIGVNRETAAVSCGIGVNTVENIERGRPSRLVTAMRLCQWLGLSLAIFDMPIPRKGETTPDAA